MQSTENQTVSRARILRMPGVEEKTGLKKSCIYALISIGEFPKSIPLVGTRARGWIESEVDEWIAGRVELREREAAA